MKALEKKLAIEQYLGLKVTNCWNEEKKDFVMVGKLNLKTGELENKQEFKDIHAAYKSFLKK